MRFISMIVIVFLGFYSVPYAQENKSKLIDEDKKKFEEDVFNKQFGEVEELDSAELRRKLYDKIPEKLPDWSLLPITTNEKTRIVGFSDPNMDKELAIEQAVLRAKAMYALLKMTSVSNITDDYTNLKESGRYSLYATKFQDFSLTKAKYAYNKSLVHVLDTFITKYDEGIVLLEIGAMGKDSINMDTLTIIGEHLQVFIERNFQKERVEFFNFLVQDNRKSDTVDLVADYRYKMVNRNYDIQSIMGDSIIEFQERTYNYRTDLDFVKDSSALETKEIRLNRGLWNAYIAGVLKNVTVISKQLASQVKNSNDFYTIKSEGLIRTVARNNVSFGFKEFKMYDNQFYIDLSGSIIY